MPHRLHEKQTHYLVRDTDLNRIDGLIMALSLAVTEIIASRELKERDNDGEMPALEDYDSQIDLIVQEAALQMDLPLERRYSSDF